VPFNWPDRNLAIGRTERLRSADASGSANVLLVPRLADSLAGRMEILRRRPLPHCELVRRALMGRLPETFVFQELRRQAGWHAASHAFFHDRNKDRAEVDVVVERETSSRSSRRSPS